MVKKNRIEQNRNGNRITCRNLKAVWFKKRQLLYSSIMKYYAVKKTKNKYKNSQLKETDVVPQNRKLLEL